MNEYMFKAEKLCILYEKNMYQNFGEKSEK